MPGSGLIRRVIQRRAEQHPGNLIEYEEVVRKQLDEISVHWLEAVEAALVAKTDVISELEQREMAIWRTSLTRDALRHDLRLQVSELGVAFEDLASTNTLLRHEIWVLERGLPRHKEQPVRNQRKLASEFDQFLRPPFRDRSLNQVLDLFRQRRVDAVSELRDMAETRAARAERMFITGCLSLEIGAWAGAEALLGLARRMRAPHDAALNREVVFFHCVARRLSANAQTFTRDYKSSRTDLSSLQRSEARTFDRMRLRNELLALDLSEAVFKRWSRSSFEEQLGSAAESWRELEGYYDRLLAPAEDDIWCIASKQFILNTFNLVFWLTVSELRPSERLLSITDRALASCEDQAYSYLRDSVHGTIYPLLARYALRPGCDRSELIQEITQSIAGALRSDNGADAAFNLPAVDKVEFTMVRQLLVTDNTMQSIASISD